MGIGDAGSRAWRWLAAHAIWVLPLVIFGGVVLYAIGIVRPFSPAKVDVAKKSEDVADSWNIGIARLGISPLYPPQEDFFVGDLWAIIVEAKDTGLIGRGIRIAHIDLTEAVKENLKREAEFNKLFDQNASNIEQKLGTEKQLYEIAFPGIALSSAVDDSASSSLSFPVVRSFLGIGASRRNDEVDDLRIPIAETYEAELTKALLTLYSYCNDVETGIRCTERFAKNLLAAAVDERIASDGQDHIDIRLELVTKVYLAKTITHRKIISGRVSLDGRVGPRGSANGKTSEESQSTETQASESGAAIIHSGDEKSELTFDETFPKPLVFGFRAVVVKPTSGG
jgi:hypothetical protein